MVVIVNAKALLNQIPASGIIVKRNVKRILYNSEIVKNKTYSWCFESRSLLKNLEFTPIVLTPQSIINISHPTLTEKAGLLTVPYYKWQRKNNRIGLFNLPVSLKPAEIIEQIQIVSQDLLPSLEVTNLQTLSFEDLKKLNCGFASVSFRSENEAKTIWEYLSTGNFCLYGHTINAIPDPSGFGIVAQAAALMYSPDFKKPACTNCVGKLHTENFKCHTLMIPDISYEHYEKYVSSGISSNSNVIGSAYLHEIQSAVVNFDQEVPVSSFCLPQRFKISISDLISANAGYLICEDNIAVCVFDAFEFSMTNVDATSESGPKTPTTQKPSTVKSSIQCNTPQTLPTRFIASKKRARSKNLLSNNLAALDALDLANSQSTLLTKEPVLPTPVFDINDKQVVAPVIKRGRGRPRGIKNLNSKK